MTTRASKKLVALRQEEHIQVKKNKRILEEEQEEEVIEDENNYEDEVHSQESQEYTTQMKPSRGGRGGGGGRNHIGKKRRNDDQEDIAVARKSKHRATTLKKKKNSIANESAFVLRKRSSKQELLKTKSSSTSPPVKTILDMNDDILAIIFSFIATRSSDSRLERINQAIASSRYVTPKHQILRDHCRDSRLQRIPFSNNYSYCHDDKCVGLASTSLYENAALLQLVCKSFHRAIITMPIFYGILNFSEYTCSPTIIVNVCERYSALSKELYLSSISALSDSTLKDILKSVGKNLRVLNISRCDLLTNKSLEHVAEFCPNLEAIDMSLCLQINDEGVSNLKTCRNLKSLSLASCYSITGLCLSELSQSLSKLSKLNVECVYDLDPTCLLQIVKRCPISSLNIYGLENLGIRPEGEKKDLFHCILETLGPNKQLEELHCTARSNTDMKSLATFCPTLKRLYCHLSPIKDTTFASVISSLSESLEELSLQGCTSVGDDTADALLDLEFKNLKLLNLVRATQMISVKQRSKLKKKYRNRIVMLDDP